MATVFDRLRLREPVAMGIRRRCSVGRDSSTAVGPFPVIETGAPQLAVVELEAEWLNKVQPATGIGGQAHDITGIGGNFGFKQGDMQHR